MNVKKTFSIFKITTILFILMNFGIARSSFSANTRSGIETQNNKKTELVDTRTQYPKQPERLSGLSVAGFVCSMLGIALIASLSFFLLGTLLSLAGIVFSAVGLKQTKNGQQGKGFAVAGLILGILGAIISAGIISYFILFW